MGSVNVLICSGMGINCQRETLAAITLAGGDGQIHHINDLLSGDVDLTPFQLIIFPGGFSFGDDLGAGVALKAKIKYHRLPDGETLWDKLCSFLDDGGYLLGICNGFQVLTSLGLLPNLSGRFEQEVALVGNRSERFENRWCRVGINRGDHFLRNHQIFQFPVRHAQGRLTILNDAIRKGIISRKLDLLSYVDHEQKSTAVYPNNPNGSELNCAGLIDERGHVIGIMPHPEAFLSPYNHPEWSNREDQEGDGLTFFKALLKEIR